MAILLVGSGRWASLYSAHIEYEHVVLGAEVEDLPPGKNRIGVIKCGIAEYHITLALHAAKFEAVVLIVPPHMKAELVRVLEAIGFQGSVYLEKPAATTIEDLDYFSQCKCDLRIVLKHAHASIFKQLLEYQPSGNSTVKITRPEFRPGVDNWRKNIDPGLEEGIHFVDFMERLHRSKIIDISRSIILPNCYEYQLWFANNQKSTIDLVFVPGSAITKKIIEFDDVQMIWEYNNGIHKTLSVGGVQVQIKKDADTIFKAGLDGAARLKDKIELHRMLIDISAHK